MLFRSHYAIDVALGGLVLMAGGCQTFVADPIQGPRNSSAPVVQAPPLMLGVAWYPEQWPEARWEADLQLMQDAGVKMVRVGEFAWSTLEPAEGRFDFAWLERAIDAAARHGIVTVLCTPTDAPPAWLTDKYPDTLRVDENGVQLRHGGRRQFSYTSPHYLALCADIVSRLAHRFGHDHNVIAWQVGNEYTDESYDDYSRKLFHDWLRNRFSTIAALNDHWATAYWSQTYDRFDEVPLPGKTDNPGLQLEWKHFITDEWRTFQNNQIAAIRGSGDFRQPITTNLGGLGWADKFDRGVIAHDLDFISWDAYVGQGHLEPYRMGATHDLVRGWKGQNFWVMETQPGSVNWAGVNNTLDRGETRALAWEAVGHGADCLAYWQWRDALNGQEQYHGAIVGADGEPLPIYGEIKQIGAEFGRAAGALAGTAPQSDVAILHDYDSRWAIDFQPHSNRYDQITVLLGYYRALRDVTQSVDIVSVVGPGGADLAKYKLIVAPSLNVITDETARRLLAYVEAGGHLVLGPRSGMKDQFNALQPAKQPGPLVAALGGHVEQYYALLEDVPVTGTIGTGLATIWAETLSTQSADASVLLRYGQDSGGWLNGQPAAVTRKVGKGSLTYVGAILDGALMANMARTLVADAAVRPTVLAAPDGVEVCRRVGTGVFVGKEVFVIINHGAGEVTVRLPAGMTDVLHEDAAITELRLVPHDAAVIQRKQ